MASVVILARPMGHLWNTSGLFRAVAEGACWKSVLSDAWVDSEDSDELVAFPAIQVHVPGPRESTRRNITGVDTRGLVKVALKLCCCVAVLGAVPSEAIVRVDERGLVSVDLSVGVVVAVVSSRVAGGAVASVGTDGAEDTFGGVLVSEVVVFGCTGGVIRNLKNTRDDNAGDGSTTFGEAAPVLY